MDKSALRKEIREKKRAMTPEEINSRSEKSDYTPMFQKAVRERRCLIPVSGYYEWRRTASGAKTKDKFSIVSKGGQEKLQLRLRKKHMEQLIRKGAEKIEFVADDKNKGVAFEREIYRKNGQEPRAKDSVGFWKSGDITIDGKEFQVKRNGAQIVTFQTIHNLQKCGKNWRDYQPKRGR